MKARALEWVHTRHFHPNFGKQGLLEFNLLPSASRSRPFPGACTRSHIARGRNKQGVHHVYMCVPANYTLSTLLLSQRTSICCFSAAVRHASRRATHERHHHPNACIYHISDTDTQCLYGNCTERWIDVRSSSWGYVAAPLRLFAKTFVPFLQTATLHDDSHDC